MPFRKNISLQMGDNVISLKQDKKGNCTDENGTYIGRILSESQTKLQKETNAESDIISQETLYFETPDKKKQPFVLNDRNIYEPLIISNPKDFKILVAISSYKRPLFLSGQILRFLNQTYQNFDISVSIKGFEKQENELTFLQEWAPLIQKNKMRLTFDTNKGQLANLLDTMRGVDLSQYDYICKVDDDDWYAPAYLETLNHHLNTDTDIAVSVTPNLYHILNASTTAYLRSGYFSWPGATMCFQKKVADKLFEIEKMQASDIQKQLPPDTLVKKPYTVTGEDILIGELAQKNGKVQTRTSAIPLFVHGNQYPSMTKPF